jgi:hypothetical protein
MTKTTVIANPFVYGQVLLPGRPFCARPDLEAKVREAAQNQGRIVLIGDRRMGKSSLVEHTLLSSAHVLLAVDLRGLDSVEDFIDRLTLRLSAALKAHRALLKHLPAPLQDALEFLDELKLTVGPVDLSARGKPKASTVVRAMDAVERASRWKPLTVFFDEFQEIVENLDERDSRHLLGVLRGEIQRHARVAYIFAGSARGSMLEIFTGEGSHFYQSAMIQDIGPIPEADMRKFFIEQFARGGRKVDAATLQAVFALAGSSPNDQQQLAYHLWTQSTPGPVRLDALQRAFLHIMAEVGRRGEIILEEATPAQRRLLFAVALREDTESATDSFVRFAGFNTNSSVNSALRPFLKGTNALIDKHGSRLRYRERFMRLWVLLQLERNPGMFPASRLVTSSPEHKLLFAYVSGAADG